MRSWRRCGGWFLVAVVGYVGLRIGGVMYPQSNLLGGFALMFAPIYWAGLLGTLVFAVVGIISTMTARTTASHMNRGRIHSSSSVDCGPETAQEATQLLSRRSD